MKNFFNIDHFLHDFRLSNVPWNAIEHERVDVGFELMRFNGRVDRLPPELDGDIVRHELSLARIFQERLADFGARVDRAEHIAAGAMIKARDRAERFALRAFAAARRTKEDECVVSHKRKSLIPIPTPEDKLLKHQIPTSKHQRTFNNQAPTNRHEYWRLELLWMLEFGIWCFSLAGRDGIDIHTPPPAIEAHITVYQRKNRVIAAQPHVSPGYKLCPALAQNNVAGHDHFVAEFFYTQPFADAVATVLNAALSFFVSHWGKLIIIS